ncbi:MAG: DUF937 domain-containing protein [Rubricella sp.]
MSLLNMLMDAQNGAGMQRLAERFGVSPEQVGALAGMVAPAMGNAAQTRLRDGDGERVARQLMGESQARFFDDADAAASPEGQAQGAAFLQELFGADVREDMGAELSNRAGIDQGTVQELLPALAAMLQGGMQRQAPDDQLQGLLGNSRQSSGGGIMGMVAGLMGGRRGGQAQGGGALDMLNAMFDADGDGNALDDLAGRFLRR